MKIAAISDVHANLAALKEAQNIIRKSNVDYVVSAGDVIGYGDEPNECVEIVRKMVKYAVIGNHEDTILKEDISWMAMHAAVAAAHTMDKLNSSSKDWLMSLKSREDWVEDGIRFTLCHGSPDGVWGYIYAKNATEALLVNDKTDFVIHGHTHLPYAKKFRAGIIVNPGSVGQPRDTDVRGSLAIIDLNNHTVKLIRFFYRGAEEALLKRVEEYARMMSFGHGMGD